MRKKKIKNIIVNEYEKLVPKNNFDVNREISKEIVFKNSTVVISRNKKILISLLSIILFIGIFSFIFVYSQNKNRESESFSNIKLAINPEYNILVKNKNAEVMSIDPLNEDAAIAITHFNIELKKGMDLNEAINILVDVSTKLNFLSPEKEIKIFIYTDQKNVNNIVKNIDIKQGNKLNIEKKNLYEFQNEYDLKIDDFNSSSMQSFIEGIKNRDFFKQLKNSESGDIENKINDVAKEVEKTNLQIVNNLNAIQFLLLIADIDSAIYDSSKFKLFVKAKDKANMNKLRNSILQIYLECIDNNEDVDKKIEEVLDACNKENYIIRDISNLLQELSEIFEVIKDNSLASDILKLQHSDEDRMRVFLADSTNFNNSINRIDKAIDIIKKNQVENSAKKLELFRSRVDKVFEKYGRSNQAWQRDYLELKAKLYNNNEE